MRTTIISFVAITITTIITIISFTVVMHHVHYMPGGPCIAMGNKAYYHSIALQCR